MTKPELTIGEVSRVARKMMKTYYHFTGDTLRDGRPIPKPGVWLKHDGPVIPCKSGLHASEHPFDALASERTSTCVPAGRPVRWYTVAQTRARAEQAALYAMQELGGRMLALARAFVVPLEPAGTTWILAQWQAMSSIGTGLQDESVALYNETLVSDNVTIGEGCEIGPHASIGARTTVGNFVNIGEAAEIGAACILRHGAYVSHNAKAEATRT